VTAVSTYEDREIELKSLLSVVWLHKYLIAAIGAVCLAVGITLALLSTPIYRAEVVVTETRDINGGGSASGLASKLGGLASVAGINLGGAGAGGGVDARAVLGSRHLVEEFVKRNNLIPELYAEQKEPATLWKAVEDFRKDVLGIHEDKVKGTITISIDWRDRMTAARWATGFVALANDLVRTRTIRDSERGIAYLNEQIAKTSAIELRTVLYDLVQSEMKNLALANGRAEYAFTTVDPAVPPEERIRPKRTIMAGLGAVGGFLLGVVVAFVRERRSIWGLQR
jgi:uncharacterized protein involved in exopolysaccharide biosynthesis